MQRAVGLLHVVLVYGGGGEEGLSYITNPEHSKSPSACVGLLEELQKLEGPFFKCRLAEPLAPVFYVLGALY